MTTVEDAAAVVHAPERHRPRILDRPRETTGKFSWFTTVDHKKIAIIYATIGAVLLRGRRHRGAASSGCSSRSPNGTVLTAAQYNEFFTMHGTTMVFLLGMPLAVAFGNYFVPLMIGARDVAFPRLNMFGLLGLPVRRPLPLLVASCSAARPNGGWFGYAPLTSTPLVDRLPAGPRPRLLDRRPHHARHRFGRDRGQLHRHHPQHARAGHDADAHAGVRVDDARDRVPHAVRDADRHRGADHGLHGPQLPHELLQRRGRRRPAAVPEPVLDLRPSRRCTSSSSRAWASSPRSCRSSPASRCSATRSSCSPGIAIGFLGWGVWAHHMFATGPRPGRRSPRSACRRCSSRSRPA